MATAIVVFLVALGSVPDANAQDAFVVPHPSTIVTEGVGTVEVAPDYVDFWLHKRVEGETTLEATQKALAFKSQVQQELDKRELRTDDLTVTLPNALRVEAPEVQVSARLRFKTSPFMDPQTGPNEFSTLCDKVRDIAKTLEVGDQTLLGKRYRQALEGPLFGAEGKQNAESAAIALAVENAYPAAEAAAKSMQTQVIAVDNIRVNEIVWGKNPETPLQESNYNQISCTARVTVTYVFPAQQ